MALEIVVFIYFGVAAIQIVYWIAFMAALGRKKEPRQSDGSLPISVVICAHDEEENLRRLIPVLLAQDYPKFEVVIVNDRSNDNTFDMLLEETGKDHRLRMVHVSHAPPHVNGKKYGLTLGIKAAQYEWILLTDADCQPKNERWLRAMSAGFEQDKKFVLSYSPYYREPGFLNTFIRYESVITAIQYLSFALMGNPYMGIGRNMAYRKSLFLEVKGFNNFLNVTGGDDDLFVNQHARGKETVVALGEDTLVYSIPKRTWGSFFRQKLRHLSVGKLYRFKHRFLLGLFVLTGLLTWFGGIPLAIFSGYGYAIVGLMVLRVILLTITTHIAVKRFGQRFEVWAAPFLDFVYSFYYLSTGLVALVSKKVRWKN
jgi:cellulose synthase/poly-beta-1,6-N-acetylglucosamine synthase-like glycosyltransferase